MPDIKLFELGPTRSARCRWTLLEAGLTYESVGNAIEVFSDPALKEVHPLGKLPAVLIDGRPLFESAAIATAIADLVPERNLIARPGTWGRALHDQWVCFTLSELECYVSSSEINTIDFVIPEAEHVPGIIAQNQKMFRQNVAVLEQVLAQQDYLVENRFTVTDIIVGYTLNWAEEQGLVQDKENIMAYMERLFAREFCALVRHH